MKNIFIFDFKLLAFLSLSVFAFTSCDDDEGAGPTEQELITTVRLTFTSAGTSSVFNAVDADGPGGAPIVIDEIKLAENTTYALKVEFFDEQDPANVEDITEEVMEEDLHHLVCFEATGIPSPSDLDVDSNGDALGLNATFSTLGAANGTLKVSLKHEPEKSATTPCTTGETDVEVTFPVVIE